MPELISISIHLKTKENIAQSLAEVDSFSVLEKVNNSQICLMSIGLFANMSPICKL